MLNQLVRKHPGVAAIYPMGIAEALRRRLFTPGQFYVVTLSGLTVDELPDGAIHALKSIASRGVTTASADDVTILRPGRAGDCEELQVRPG